MILRGDISIGTIYAYSLNLTDRHLFVTTYITKEFQGLGYGPEVFALFIEYLFENLPLYKVYTDVYSYNTNSVRCLKKAGFVEEGRFVGHRLVNGTRYDMMRLALFKESTDLIKSFVATLKQPKKRLG